MPQKDGGFEFTVPPRQKAVSHSPVDPPLCQKCKRLELTFFDPNCPECHDILLNPKTSISEVFAIIRQWVLQVQMNIEILVKEVLRRGAHINDRDGLTDMTLLHYVSKSGAVGVGDPDGAASTVTFLLSKGADPTMRCRWTDMLPLHYAAFFDGASVIRVLLKATNGKDVNATCKEYDGGSSLHIAGCNLCFSAVKCLLQHGANPSLKDKQNRTALQCIPDIDDCDPSSESVTVHEKLTRLLTEAEPHDEKSNGISGLLDGTGINLGDRVVVGGLKTGTLRFCGETEFASGIWAGVELDEPAGKNDGSVQGIAYFTCKHKHGIFAPLSKIELPNASQPGSQPSSRPQSGSRIPFVVQDGAKSGSQPSSKPSSTPNSRPGSRPESPQLTEATVNGTANGIESDIKVGDRVVVAGQKSGTVHFVGHTQFASGTWYGVELDQAVGKNDGSVGGVQYFNCKSRHGVFAPPSRVTKEVKQEPKSPPSGSIPQMTRSGSQSLIPMKRSQRGDDDHPVMTRAGSQPDLSKRKGSTENLHTQSGRTGSVPDLAPKKTEKTPQKRTIQKSSGLNDLKLTEGASVYYSNELGVVRYIGSTHFSDGTWLGIEMRKPVGKNDGSVSGKRYFSCKPNYGLFVRPNRATCRGISCDKLLNDSSGEL